MSIIASGTYNLYITVSTEKAMTASVLMSSTGARDTREEKCVHEFLECNTRGNLVTSTSKTSYQTPPSPTVHPRGYRHIGFCQTNVLRCLKFCTLVPQLWPRLS